MGNYGYSRYQGDKDYKKVKDLCLLTSRIRGVWNALYDIQRPGNLNPGAKHSNESFQLYDSPNSILIRDYGAKDSIRCSTTIKQRVWISASSWTE